VGCDSVHSNNQFCIEWKVASEERSVIDDLLRSETAAGSPETES